MNGAILLITTAVNDFLDTKAQSINWDAASLPGKWSNKEIIGHLIDSAQINLHRFIRCTYEENFRLTYEQDTWVAIQHYQDADVNELLNLWRLLNKHIIRVLKNYPTNKLNARCDNSKLEPNLQTVAWQANDYAEHLKHHLKQLE